MVKDTKPTLSNDSTNSLQPNPHTGQRSTQKNSQQTVNNQHLMLTISQLMKICYMCMDEPQTDHYKAQITDLSSDLLTFVSENFKCYDHLTTLALSAVTKLLPDVFFTLSVSMG